VLLAELLPGVRQTSAVKATLENIASHRTQVCSALNQLTHRSDSAKARPLTQSGPLGHVV